MDTAIIVAIISGVVALVGSLVGSILTFIISMKQIQNKQREEQAKQLEQLRSDLNKKLEEHRTEYIEGITDIKEKISDVKTAYQHTSIVMELKIDALEKKQDVHNNLISRMYEVEKRTDLQEEMIKVANHRIQDLENKS